MSANAANVQLSYSEGELPAQPQPTPAPAVAASPSASPAENPLDATQAGAPSTPPAKTPDAASSQPTEQPSTAGPSTAGSPAAGKPFRSTAMGKKLWSMAASIQPEEQPPVAGTSAAESPVSRETPVSALAKPSGVSAGTQTPSRDRASSPTEAKGQPSLKAAGASDKQEVSSETTEEVEDSEEEELLIPSGSMFLDQVRSLPVVRCSTSLYKRARANGLLAAPLALMECTASVAAIPVRVAAWPFATFCPTSLFLLDWTLYKGLDAVLAVCPCIAAPLNQICTEQKNCIVNTVCCCPRTARNAVSALCPKQKSA